MLNRLPGWFKNLVPDRAKHAYRALRDQPVRYRTRREYVDGGAWGAAYVLARHTVLPKRTILFYPEIPARWQVVYKLCVLNGYRMVNDPRRRYDVVHKHLAATTNQHYGGAWGGGRAINAGSNDISKARVQRVFAEVFGYELAVDPRTYHGRAVRKSDANYAHDGAIVACPYEPSEEEEGVVYQRLVETENGEGFCVDLRVPIYGGEIPLVYVKYRPRESRFENAFTRGEIVRPEGVLSGEEVMLIGTFTERMGLDFGEMDVLRDTEDGRIYIVDVNNTPAGPSSNLTLEQRQRAASALAAAYGRLVEDFAFAPPR